MKSIFPTFQRIKVTFLLIMGQLRVEGVWHHNRYEGLSLTPQEQTIQNFAPSTKYSILNTWYFVLLQSIPVHDIPWTGNWSADLRIPFVKHRTAASYGDHKLIPGWNFNVSRTFRLFSNTFSSDQVLLFTPFDGDTVFLNNLNVRKTGPLFSWLGHVLDSSGAKIGWTSISWNPSLQSYRGKFHFYSPQRTIVVESLPNGLDSVMWEVDWNAFREHYSASDTAGEYQTHLEYRAEVEKWKEKIANDPEWSAWIKERDKRILERMKQQEATQESE